MKLVSFEGALAKDRAKMSPTKVLFSIALFVLAHAAADEANATAPAPPEVLARQFLTETRADGEANTLEATVLAGEDAVAAALRFFSDQARGEPSADQILELAEVRLDVRLQPLHAPAPLMRHSRISARARQS